MEEDEELEENVVEKYLKRSKTNRKWWAKWDIDSDDEKPAKVGEEDDDIAKVPVKRKKYDREHYRESCWWKFLHRDNLSDLSSRDGKTFRNRFTVPYQLFEELLIMARNWFPQRILDAFGKEVSPIELKLLGP